MTEKLVQIHSASASPQPQRGKLPQALTDPNRRFYCKAMTAIDEIEEGIRSGDRRLVNHGHSIIHHTVTLVKRRLCHNYRYPLPSPDAPDLWEVLCTSGAAGKFNKSQHVCMSCLLFNSEFHPDFRAEA